jgi:hypothetical protein
VTGTCRVRVKYSKGFGASIIGTLAIIGGTMDLKFLKERYDFELQRKEQLTSALTLPVGVLSGLGGLMAAMVRSFPNKTLWLTVPFAVAFALDVVAFFVCLVYPARTYHRQKYLYLPLLKELEEWEQAFREFNNYAVATDDIEETFSTHLRERIIEGRPELG